MQAVLDGLADEGHEGLWIVSLNSSAAASSLDLYIPNVRGPVLQDAEGDPVRTLLEASPYNVWLVDDLGQVRFAHDHLDFPTEEPLLAAELRALLAERDR